MPGVADIWSALYEEPCKDYHILYNDMHMCAHLHIKYTVKPRTLTFPCALYGMCARVNHRVSICQELCLSVWSGTPQGSAGTVCGSARGSGSAREQSSHSVNKRYTILYGASVQ